MKEIAIRVDGLERSFGSNRVLDGLQFEVPAGSVTGLLGPNGAGKTTTLHILAGLLRRHGGDVSVLGYDPAGADVEIRRRTGFVPEDPRGEPRYTVRQNLDFQKAFRPGWDDALEKQLLNRLDLEAEKPARILSRGERAKLGLIGALAFRPELLILDDPTSGLDPLARREFIEGVIGVLAEEGRTVFFSTHQVDDIERVADRIIVLHKGRNLYAAPIEEIHRKWRCFRLSFGPSAAPDTVSLPGLRRWTPEGHAAVALFDACSDESVAAMHALAAGCEPLPFPLEDMYVELARSETGGRP